MPEPIHLPQITQIAIEQWPVETFRTRQTSGTLKLSPEYQRRSVWKPKTKMLLIDSVLRLVPIGAITLYEDASHGYEVYEVIDGKQRLQTIDEFLRDGLVVNTAVVRAAAEDDDINIESDAIASQYHGKRFSEFDVPGRMRTLHYRIPVFIVRGARKNAISAFTRMNSNLYVLKPQEIRNALFVSATSLKTAIAVVTDLAEAHDATESGFFVALGAVSPDGFKRMQDVQLSAELLLLIMKGPTHRRDELDEWYETYQDPTGDALRALERAKDQLQRICSQVWALTEGTILNAFHFPAACENDFYALVGALNARGLLTEPQMEVVGRELMIVISGFREQVENFVAKVRSGEIGGDFDAEVEAYGRTFLGGQTNSKQRRSERIEIWRSVIGSVVATLDPQSAFAPVQRRLIWARSSDKLCARCGRVVEWTDYHAGHRVAHSLGGRTVIENGQVEHAACNQGAGATG